MDCYKEMYYKLFNSITDAIEELKEAQQEAEEMLISHESEKPENVLRIQRKDEDDKKPPES